MTKPTTPLPNVVLAALEVLSDHIQAQAKALTRIRNIVDAQDSTEDTPTLVEREIEALGKELAAKDRDIQNLETDATIICSDYKELLIDKKIAEARVKVLEGIEQLAYEYTRIDRADVTLTGAKLREAIGKYRAEAALRGEEG